MTDFPTPADRGELIRELARISSAASASNSSAAMLSFGSWLTAGFSAAAIALLAGIENLAPVLGFRAYAMCVTVSLIGMAIGAVHRFLSLVYETEQKLNSMPVTGVQMTPDDIEIFNQESSKLSVFKHRLFRTTPIASIVTKDHRLRVASRRALINAVVIGTQVGLAGCIGVIVVKRLWAYDFALVAAQFAGT